LTDNDEKGILKRCSNHFNGFPAYLKAEYAKDCTEKWNFCEMCCE